MVEDNILDYISSSFATTFVGKAKNMLTKYTIIISLLFISTVNAGGIASADNMSKPKLANKAILLKMGTVTIAIDSSKITIENKLEKIDIQYGYSNNYKRDGGYYYIINDPFTPLDFHDGYPYKCSPKQAVDLFYSYSLKHIKKSNFRKFSFFNSKSTTIGVLTGIAGGSGGSSQKMYFFDTTSEKYAIISFSDGIYPTWIRYSSDKAPIYLTKKYSYIGGRSKYMGYGLRISGIYCFKNSSYRQDSEFEKAFFLQLYKKSLLTLGEIKYFKQATMQNIYNDRSKSIVRLLDYFYYARKAGKSHELTKFFTAMTKSLQKALSYEFMPQLRHGK